MRMNKILQSGLAIVLAICLLLPGGFFSEAALAEDTTMDGTVRVYLSSLGSPSRLDITICGSYSLDGNGATALANGSTVTVGFNSTTGQLTLTQNGVTTAMGTDFRLRRHTTSAADNGVKISQARVSGNLYPGDLQFKSVRSGGVYKLYTIAHVFIEDYLCGVLPYEMGNSSPLESLKAQCVSARTYTVRAMNASTARSYDVVDTTNDQVYNGTPSGNARCVQAVQETRGLVSMNGNAYTATYYTASNGGQIESVRNIWGSTQYDYITVKDDPYDYQNPASVVRSFQVNKSGTQSNSTLGSLLNAKAQAVFGTQSVSIESIDAITPHTPRYAAPSRLYTKLDFDVTVTANGTRSAGTLTFDIFSELETPLNMGINAASNELCGAIRTEAKRIAKKYIVPPYTTDFAVMFLATEGLYAEALRSRGLMEELQQNQRVLIAGPSTLSALLSSLQLGFRTLAIEQRSAEVWQLLGAVKTEFGRFSDLLDQTQQRLRQAGETIEKASVRTRAINRRLRDVEALSDAQSVKLLPLDDAQDEESASLSRQFCSHIKPSFCHNNAEGSCYG